MGGDVGEHLSCEAPRSSRVLQHRGESRLPDGSSEADWLASLRRAAGGGREGEERISHDAEAGAGGGAAGTLPSPCT